MSECEPKAKTVVDKAARGGETVLKHLKYIGNSVFLCYFSVFCKNYLFSYGVIGVFYSVITRKNRGFFGVEGPPYGVSNLH